MKRDQPTASDLAARARTQGVFPLVESGAYRLRAVQCDAPFLALPLCGQKRIHLKGQTLSCRPGAFAFWQQPCRLDVENDPDGDVAYRAIVIPFSLPAIELARSLLDRHRSRPVSAPAVVCAPLAAIRGPLDELLASSSEDPAGFELRQAGLLLALATAGADGFRIAREPSLAEKIRHRIADNPAFAWTSARIEEEFAISGATLRRRLAAEGCSLRELLREARLHHALKLLQTSRQPLKAIAQATGYRSTAQFSRRFAERFGVEASAVMQI